MEFWVVYSMILTGVLSTLNVFWVVSDCPEIHGTGWGGGRARKRRSWAEWRGMGQKHCCSFLLISFRASRGDDNVQWQVLHNDKKKPGKTGPQERKIKTHWTFRRYTGWICRSKLGYTILFLNIKSSSCYTHPEKNLFLNCTKSLLWTYIRATISMQFWDA